MALTIFSWGYWGWGNATRKLVEAFDRAERWAGFRRPIFVDIRFRRQGRAKGFVDDAFRKVVGTERYLWMQDLGNARIGSGRGGYTISWPPAAEKLLDLAITAANHHRRVIFFCACPAPRDNGRLACHRDAVTYLLLAEAIKRGVPTTVVEWPGGKPKSIRRPLSVDSKLFSSVNDGRWYIPFDGKRLGEFAALPWGSILTLKCRENGQSVFVAVGPAVFAATGKRRGEWRLPVCWQAEEGKTKAEIRRDIQEWRRECGYFEQCTAA